MKRLLLSLCLLPSITFAALPVVDQPLPSLEINDKGVVLLENDQTVYQDWSSTSLKGKVFAIQAMAGRTSAQDLNAPMIDAITAAQYAAEDFQMVSIINSDDAIWGTSLFVKNAIEGSKREHPYAAFVVDDNSAINKVWSLEKEGSAIIIVNRDGEVVFVKDGALTEAEVKDAIGAINANI